MDTRVYGAMTWNTYRVPDPSGKITPPTGKYTEDTSGTDLLPEQFSHLMQIRTNNS
jgi:hypothetical protein